MGAKQYLRQIREERLEIEQLYDRIEELNWSLLPSGIRYDTIRVQTSPDNQLEEICSKIDLCERSLCDHLAKLVDRYNKAVGYVNRLDKSEHRQVLTLYYLSKDRPTWEQVAREMGYSDRRVYDIYNDAIAELEKIWPKSA